MKRRGFTLTELLAVLGIMGVLAVIIVPVAVSARRRGQSTACLSNVKQFGMALQMYARDYDDAYPAIIATPFEDGHSHPSNDSLWYSAVLPYTKNHLFVCPSRAVSAPWEKYVYTCGYAMNYYLNEYADAKKAERLVGINDSQLTYTSHIVLLMDARPGIAGLRLPDFDKKLIAGTYDFSMIKEIESQTPGGIRHGGGANYAFADGHAKWVRAFGFKSKCDGTYPCFKP